MRTYSTTYKKNESGFTLLEVILSVALLTTIIMLTINLSSNEIILRQKISDRYPFEKVMNRIARDISGAFLLRNNTQENKISFIHSKTSENSSLIFNVNNHDSLIYDSKESNLAKIGYFVETSNGINQLIRVVDTKMEENKSIPSEGVGIRTILVDDIKNFTLKFWHKKEFVDDWNSTTNEKDKLPKLVKIILTIYLSDNKTGKKREEHLEMITFVRNSINKPQGEKTRVEDGESEEFLWQ